MKKTARLLLPNPVNKNTPSKQNRGKSYAAETQVLRMLWSKLPRPRSWLILRLAPSCHLAVRQASEGEYHDDNLPQAQIPHPDIDITTNSVVLMAASQNFQHRIMRAFFTILLFSLAAAGSCGSKTWSIAATGDLLGSFVATDDEMTKAVWDVTRSSTFSFFNMEGQMLDSATFTGYPASENGGDNTYGDVGGGPTYDPAQALLLSEAGFNLASHANNHAWDYELTGMEETHASLSAANISFAGSGRSLSEARDATFVQRGNIRLSFLSAAGTHTPQSVAGPGNADQGLAPRPGANVLRAQPVTVLNDADFSIIQKIAAAQGQDLPDDVSDITLYTGQHPISWSYWRRQSAAEAPSIAWDINDADYVGILSSIRDAKSESNATVFSFHAHESESGAGDSYVPLPPRSTVPAPYIRNITRSAIEAGADIVLVHGPHHLRGIEIHHGRPIFYGLSHLTYSLGLNFRGYELPIEWDDGVIAQTTFDNDFVSKIVLYPLVHNQLTNDSSLPDRTMPKIAPLAESQRILAHLQRVSEPFGTRIKVNGTVGYIDLTSD